MIVNNTLSIFFLKKGYTLSIHNFSSIRYEKKCNGLYVFGQYIKKKYSRTVFISFLSIYLPKLRKPDNEQIFFLFFDLYFSLHETQLQQRYNRTQKTDLHFLFLHDDSEIDSVSSQYQHDKAAVQLLSISFTNHENIINIRLWASVKA